MNPRRSMSDEPPIADALRRIETAFAEGGRRNAPPSPEILRAAEALLFAGGQVMTAAELAEKLGPEADVAAVLMQLKKDYAGRGVELVEAAGGWRFQTAGDLAHLFAEVRETPKKLPKAAMETLAVIAYHQPVTRADIEQVRGVSLNRGTLDLLLEMGFVRLRGRRRSPGRPVTYGTTDLFLEQFSLANLGDLPGAAEMKAAGLLDMGVPAGFEVPDPSRAEDGDLLSMDDGDDAPEFHQDFVGGEEP